MLVRNLIFPIYSAIWLLTLAVPANLEQPTTAEIFIFPFVKLTIIVITYLQRHPGILTSSKPSNGNYLIDFVRGLSNPRNSLTILRNGINSFINVTRDREDAERTEPDLIHKIIGFHYYDGKGSKFPSNEVECLFFKNIFDGLKNTSGIDLVPLAIKAYPAYVTDENKARFLLYNERNELYKTVTFGDKAKLGGVRLAKGSRLFVIAHGMLQDSSSSWIHDLKDMIWRKTKRVPKPSFLLVDWRDRAMDVFVNRVAANVKVVGLELFDFLRTFTKCNVFNMNNAHFIGFNYGSQVIGIAGKRLSEEKNLTDDTKYFVEKITSLTQTDDCFSPNLRKQIITRGKVRIGITRKLSPFSALQVTVLHTSARFLGSYHKIGNTDIYFNGNSQPGCVARLASIFNVYAGYLGELCNVFHSVEVITRDYNKPEAKGCQPIAYRCESYGAYLNGKCQNCDSQNCQLAGIPIQIGEDERDILRTVPNAFGVNPSQFRRNYYLDLREDDPYCAFNYQLQIFSDANPGNVGMWLELVDQYGTVYRQSLSLDRSSGTLVSLPVKLAKGNEPIRFVEGYLKYINTPLFAAVLGDPFKFLIYGIYSKYTSHFDKEVRKKYSTLLCADNDQTLVREFPIVDVIKNITASSPLPFIPLIRFLIPKFIVEVPLSIANHDLETCAIAAKLVKEVIVP